MACADSGQDDADNNPISVETPADQDSIDPQQYFHECMGSMEQMNNIQGLNTFNDDNNNTRVINIDSFPVYSSDTKYSAMNTFTSDANTNLQACQKHKTSCSSSD